MWYAVSLLYESIHDGRPSENDLWEERIVLVNAATESAARQEAERLGQEEECVYTSATGEDVRWLFRRIQQVCEIDAEVLTHGTELFGRFLSAKEVQSLSSPIRESPLAPSQAKSAQGIHTG